jgi:SOS-response transcriptional repressor LexA
MTTKADRLRESRLAAGFKSTLAAAERLGVSASTYRAHENGQNDFNDEQAQHYARTFRVSPAYLMFGTIDDASRHPDAEGFDHTKTMRIPVRGEVAAGQWLETVPFLDDLEIDDWLDGLAVPEGMKQFTYALKVKGPSINRLAPDGTYLVCLDITSGVEIHHRDVVIVEKIRDQGALREVTAKRLLQRGDELVLMPESDDPAWQKEIVLKDDPYQMDAEIRIVAKVKHVVRPL